MHSCSVIGHEMGHAFDDQGSKTDGRGAQRFFLSYAQTFRENIREGQLRANLSSDPHSPSIFRVNGVVRNMDEWYVTFGVQPKDALYLAPRDRVRIW